MLDQLLHKSNQRSLIIAITIGSVLEWYEIFLYIYWAPLIQGIFFQYSTEFFDFAGAILVFAFGFLSRPLGGIIFGFIGDRFGRKTSFTLSIILAALPSIAIAFIPSYQSWDTVSAIFLVFLRLLQGIPAGGELPGAMCYLEEMASPKQRKFIGSFTFVGAQFGGIFSLVTCILFQAFLPHKFLVNWGWRISFLIGGAIGLFGYHLREQLKESPSFEHLKEKHQIYKSPLSHAFRSYKGKMLVAFFVSISEVVGFFTISIFPVIYFKNLFGTSVITNALFTTFFLTFSAITIPLFGKLGDKYKYKPLFFISLIGMILLVIPFYISIKATNLPFTLVNEFVFLFFLNFQLALLPSLLTDLFPTSIRFTCIGISFNICDGLIGGIIPFLAIMLVRETRNPASFVLIFLFSAIVSLLALLFIKEPKNLPEKETKAKFDESIE